METNRLLWLTVIRTAIEDTSEFKRSLRNPAIRWLLHDNKDFPEICQMAGINSNYLRERILYRLAVPTDTV